VDVWISNFAAVVLEGVACITYASDAIEPGVVGPSNMTAYPRAGSRCYVALGEAPATARSACGPGLPVAARVLLRRRSHGCVTSRVGGVPS